MNQGALSNSFEPRTPDSVLAREIARRRTFAIISHPDAGKTTLTEKCLLYAGQIAEAGAVRGRKTQRAVTSDWMALERERGISITSTALTFEYRGHLLNLLDTPGHQDFSEDTYRTLAAADCAVMVLDAANGVEGQTRKLFRVCAARKIPILTFINKMDRLGKSPLELLSEIQADLGIEPVPMNWPIGLGEEFTGIHERTAGRTLLFSPTDRGSLQVPTRTVALADLDPQIGHDLARRTRDEVELIDIAGGTLDLDRFHRGEQTPVFFGCAANNYGIEPFLDAFVGLAPTPGPRAGVDGPVSPDREQFAGQVFKIQANLNPKHRDRVAFVRVCAGVFSPDFDPVVARTGDRLRMKGSHRLFAQDREEVHAAYPGDIIGLAFTKGLRLGDTLYDGPAVEFSGLPQFSPECFAAVRCSDNARRKQLTAGLQQLADEGAIQVFTDPDRPLEPILAAVGVLQFDVVKFRLESEYGVEVAIAPLNYRAGGWVGAGRAALTNRQPFHSTRIVFDHRDRPVVLAEDAFSIRYLKGKEPQLQIRPFSDDLFAPTG
jgi:peptide chain release factor 3